jgi:hypothetical protein
MFLHLQWYRQWLLWLPTNNSCSSKKKKKNFIWHDLHRPKPRININFVSNLTHIATILKLARTYILCSPFWYLVRPPRLLPLIFLIKPPQYLLLMPDAHLTHQHEEKGTPLHSSTPAATTSLNSEWPHGHNSRPLWHPVTPRHQRRKAQSPSGQHN